jgi:hypothetical protein
MKSLVLPCTQKNEIPLAFAQDAVHFHWPRMHASNVLGHCKAPGPQPLASKLTQEFQLPVP